MARRSTATEADSALPSEEDLSPTSDSAPEPAGRIERTTYTASSRYRPSSRQSGWSPAERDVQRAYATSTGVRRPEESTSASWTTSPGANPRRASSCSAERRRPAPVRSSAGAALAVSPRPATARAVGAGLRGAAPAHVPSGVSTTTAVQGALGGGGAVDGTEAAESDGGERSVGRSEEARRTVALCAPFVMQSAAPGGAGWPSERAAPKGAAPRAAARSTQAKRGAMKRGVARRRAPRVGLNYRSRRMAELQRRPLRPHPLARQCRTGKQTTCERNARWSGQHAQRQPISRCQKIRPWCSSGACYCGAEDINLRGAPPTGGGDSPLACRLSRDDPSAVEAT